MIWAWWNKGCGVVVVKVSTPSLFTGGGLQAQHIAAHMPVSCCCCRSCCPCLQDLSPASVPSWQRVRAANLLASSGRSWVEVFKRHNSGTYNNQVGIAATRGKPHALPATFWDGVAVFLLKHKPTLLVGSQPFAAAKSISLDPDTSAVYPLHLPPAHCSVGLMSG
jgi:hypothetical protein